VGGPNSGSGLKWWDSAGLWKLPTAEQGLGGRPSGHAQENVETHQATTEPSKQQLNDLAEALASASAHGLATQAVPAGEQAAA